MFYDVTMKYILDSKPRLSLLIRVKGVGYGQDRVKANNTVT